MWLTSPHALFAQWTANTCLVTFAGNGGTPMEQYAWQAYNDKYTIPTNTPTRTGYAFTGWAKADGTRVTTATTMTQSSAHTLYAQWSANVYTATFDAQGGAVTPASKQVTFGTALGILPVPKRGGWYFAGWWTGPDRTGDQKKSSSILTTEGLALYAYWTGDPAQALSPYLSDTDGAAASPLITTAYDGFAYDDENTVRGMVTLNAKATLKTDRTTGAVATNWTFSAKAILQGATVSFSGKLTGVADHFVAETKSKETLDVHVAQDRFFGTLTGGKVGGTLSIDGARNAFADKATKETAQISQNGILGLYNVALLSSAPDGAAQSEGYLALSVGKAGSVKIAGKLGDGTALSGSAKLLEGLNENGWHGIVLHKPLYSRKGFVGGLLWINPTDKVIRVDADDYNWSVDWASQDPKKEMFWRRMDAAGGYFGDGKSAPSVPSGLVFGMSETTLPAPVANLTDDAWVTDAFPWELPVVYGANGKLTLPKATAPKKVWTIYDYAWGNNPSSATLAYTPATGLFKGTFRLYYDGYTAKGSLQHKTVSVPYSGVMILTRDAVWAGAPAGIGIGTATLGKQKTPVPVYLVK